MSLTPTLLCLILPHLTTSHFSLKIIILAYIRLLARPATHLGARMALTITRVCTAETRMQQSLT